MDLFFILTTFSFISEHFERSRLTNVIKHIIPNSPSGYFVLLFITFVLSIFLDNIIAALIGGTIAKGIIGDICVPFVAALVAAANAGGAGSVLGDTTTTMIWLSGVPGATLLYAFYGSFIALLLFGIPASWYQYRRIEPKKQEPADKKSTNIDWTRLFFVVFLLCILLAANTIKNNYSNIDFINNYPVVGIAMIFSCFLTSLWRKVSKTTLEKNMSGHFLLLGLIINANLLDISSLPKPSTISTFMLGITSAFLDNIPLTAMAIEQKGYNWPLLAFSVGFGGSLMWFGSSAGVVLTQHLKKGRVIKDWISFPLILSFVAGFYAIHLSVPQ
ncbi:citrate transporter [Candidatus Ichthyocystis hellenicum]|uniref:citrate transporter n=1 Tax=Candidatus Ichthyocystis hellenicum TaxID=1561003 RepID=UPI001F5E9470|nr:citrate transporter [Candidatus Ichthyocystis hellenicum]